MDAKKCDFCGEFFMEDRRIASSIKIESYFNSSLLDMCPICARGLLGKIQDEKRRTMLLNRFMREDLS